METTDNRCSLSFNAARIVAAKTMAATSGVCNVSSNWAGRILAALFFVLAFQGATAWSRQVLTGNPLLDKLINEGFETPSGDLINLPVPTLSDDMTGEQQDAAILPIAKPLGVQNFLDGGISASHSYKQTNGQKLKDKSTVRAVDVYFVARGNVEDVAKEKLLDNVFASEKKNKNPGIPEDSRELLPEELGKAGLIMGKQDDGSIIGYGTAQANLLDKVYLDIVTKSQTTQAENSVVLATMVAPDVAKAVGLPCTWQPIERVKNVPTIKQPKSDYKGAAGYAKATKLKNVPGCILVEIHLVFVEPEGWFNGANLLASKLSTVVRSAVPDFRRNLLRVQANPKGNN